LEMYRQLGVEDMDVVLWTTGEANAKKLQEVLK